MSIRKTTSKTKAKAAASAKAATKAAAKPKRASSPKAKSASKSKSAPKPKSKGSTSAIDPVHEILADYAARAVFRGFSRGTSTATKAAFRMLWHRDRFFDLILDTKAGTLTMPLVLPDVPADSSMYREVQLWIKERHSKDLPDHRRIDPRKARLTCGNSRGSVSLKMTLKSKDYGYATRKLIHAVHEVFLAFLLEGPYYDYMVEAFDLDPDRP
ncbi:MAG: hypothetical protein ABI823_21895 [Bryobacteraceae bacterium]